MGESRLPGLTGEVPVPDGAELLAPGRDVETPRGDNTKAVVVITGMHRSGTSLTASVFAEAGVHIGDRLDGPGIGNRWGHFEDVEFQAFHERVLRRVGKSFLTATPADLIQPTVEELEQARALVARRCVRGLWGWKDPRTCLFLDFWHPLLDQPRYVLVYRHPIEVALSLLRRGAEVDLQALENPALALEAWRVHNQAILDFYRQHPGRCVLGHIRALTADLARFVATCSTRLDLPLESEGVRHLYHAEDLSEVAVPPEALATLTRLVPEVTALYARLEETADFPDGGVSRALTPQPQPQRTAVAEPGTSTAGDHEVLACLARVDLETVLHGKESLDVVRRDHIRALRQELVARGEDSKARGAAAETEHALTQARVIELAEHNAALRAEVALLERWRADHQAEIGLAQERLLAATAQAAKAETRAGELADRLATSIEDARQRIAAVESEAAASRARADKLETSTTLLAQERDDAERLLAAILRTRAWRAAQKWYAVKQMALRLLAPNTPAGAARTNGGGAPPAAAGSSVGPDAERRHRASQPPGE